jgi:hypothetical protein
MVLSAELSLPGQANVAQTSESLLDLLNSPAPLFGALGDDTDTVIWQSHQMSLGYNAQLNQSQDTPSFGAPQQRARYGNKFNRSFFFFSEKRK